MAAHSAGVSAERWSPCRLGRISTPGHGQKDAGSRISKSVRNEEDVSAIQHGMLEPGGELMST